MGGEHQYFGYLYTLRGTGCIEGYVSDVVARKGLNAAIYVICTLCVAVETDVREIGLYESWFDVGDAHAGVGYVDAQTIGDGLDGTLGGPLYINS